MSTRKTLRELDVEQQGRRFGRRSVLQTVAAGAVGLGLAGGASIASAGEPRLGRPKDGDLPKVDPSLLEKMPKCPDLLKVSKRLDARLYLRTCERCTCGNDVTFIVPYFIRGFLYTNDACDETARIWPDQTEVTAEGTMTLRQAKCENGPHLVGCNRGRITIRGKDAGVVSELFGTQGFETHASGARRCCAANHGEGTWNGRGYDRLEGCKLCVSYVSELYTLDPERPCEMRSIRMRANLDGVLICPCERPS